MNEKRILKVCVGSRLHGTNRKNSDYDYRYIVVAPTEEVISFGYDPKSVPRMHKSATEDPNIWEVYRFIEIACNGNMTALEVLMANPLEMTWEGAELRSLLPCFLHKDRIYHSCRAFAKKQLQLMKNENTKRRRVSASHYLRVLYNGAELLTKGTMTSRIVDTLIGEDVIKAKSGELSYDIVEKKGLALELELTKAFENSILDRNINYDRINEVLVKIRRENWVVDK